MGVAVLAVVDVVKAGPVAASDVKVSIAAEQECADRVAGEDLAPVLDEDVVAAPDLDPSGLCGRGDC